MSEFGVILQQVARDLDRRSESVRSLKRLLLSPRCLFPEPAPSNATQAGGGTQRLQHKYDELAAPAAVADEMPQLSQAQRPKPRPMTLAELKERLSRPLGIGELTKLRREFALSRHPDRQSKEWEAATADMATANDLIDRAVHRIETGRASS